MAPLESLPDLDDPIDLLDDTTSFDLDLDLAFGDPLPFDDPLFFLVLVPLDSRYGSVPDPEDCPDSNCLSCAMSTDKIAESFESEVLVTTDPDRDERVRTPEEPSFCTSGIPVSHERLILVEDFCSDSKDRESLLESLCSGTG